MANPWEEYGGNSKVTSSGPWSEYGDSGKSESKSDPMEELRNKSLLGQAVSGAVGAPEAGLSMASTVPAMAAGGGRALAGLATGDSLEEAGQKAKETTDKYTYEPRSAAGKIFNQVLGEGFEYAKEKAGDILAYQARENRDIPGTEGMSPAEMQKIPLDPQEEAKYRSAGEFGFEAPMAAAPVAGMLKFRPKEAPIEAPRKAPPSQAPWDAYQADLFEKDPMGGEFNASPIDNPQQMVRGAPFNLDPAEVAKRQAEYDSQVEQYARENQARQGQGDLFQTTQEDLQQRLEQGGTGMRDTSPSPDLEYKGVREGDLAPKLTEQEYLGPREQRPLPDNSIDYAKNARLADGNAGQFHSIELAAKMQETAKDSSKNAVRGGLEHISKNSDVPFYRKLADKLLEDKDFKPDYEITDKTEGNAAQYIVGEHKVKMHPTWKGNEQVLLHEAIHARVYGPIQAYLASRVGMVGGWKQMKHLEVPAKRIVDMFETLKKGGNIPEVLTRDLGTRKEAYGLQDVHEFVAEGLSNPAFQSKLAQIKLPPELASKGLYKYYWDSFVDSVAKMLGFTRESNTYLSELLRASSDLMNGTKSNERIYYADLLDPGKDLGSPPPEKTPMDHMKVGARDFALDRRPIKEVISDLAAALKSGKKFEDFTAKDSNELWQVVKNLGSLVKENLLQDTTLGQVLMRHKEGTGPLIKWTVDQVSRIERENMIKVKNARDIALQPFRKMYHDKASRPALIEAVKTWQDAVGKRDLTRADFKSDKQWDVYKNFMGVMDHILSDVNARREKAGLTPINRIPSYFHAAWEGDYRVFGYDGAGNKVWASGFDTRLGAKKAVDKLREKHPEIRFDDPEHIKTDKYGLRDISAFEDAIRVMSNKDNKITQALQETYREILQHRGFGRTGVYRKGVMGYLGSEGGNLGLKNVERSFDQYVNRAYQYIGNLDKQNVWADLQKVPKEMWEKIPETRDFLYSYVRKAQGAKLHEMAIDSFIGNVSKAIGFGQHGPLKAAREIAGVASLWWLTTPRFLISQAVQSANAIPKLIQGHGIVDGTKAYFDGLKNSIAPDAIAKEATKWAADKQYLDATIKTMVDKPIYTEGPIQSWAQLIKEAAQKPAALIEHHLVRQVAFLSFEKALRSSMKDKERRFEEAAEKADYYMVNYGRTHSPMIYDKLGLSGELARPLKQYSHNTWGQFIEFAHGAKNRAEYAPLASFLAVQATMSGLKGVILVAEATAIVNGINAMFDTDIPTPEQLMLKSGMHDALVFGGLSAALDTDVSSSVAAPSLPQMFSFPAINFAGRVAANVGNYVKKVISGEDTDQDRMNAIMALSPNFMHEFIRWVYTQTGYPTANQFDSNLRGNYRRTPADNFFAIGIGGKPLKEAHMDAIMRSAKQELKGDMERRINALDAIADRIFHGQSPDQSLMEKYVKEGGDPSRLGSNIMQKMKERMMTGPEREQSSSRMGPTQIHKLDTYREYLDRTVPYDPDRPMGVDVQTGEIKPISVETGIDGKRLYNDTEGNPEGGFVSKLPLDSSTKDKNIKLPEPSKDDAMGTSPDEFRKRKLFKRSLTYRT